MPNESKYIDYRKLLKTFMAAVLDADPDLGDRCIDRAWGEYTNPEGQALAEIRAELHFEAAR